MHSWIGASFCQSGLSRMRTETLSNRRRRGEKRAIGRIDKGKGAGFGGPAFVSDVTAYHHLGIWSRCPRFGGLCRYRHGSAPRSEDAGCLDSAMVSAASPRSRRLQSPKPEPSAPQLWGGGWAPPSVLSRPWSSRGDSSPAAVLSLAGILERRSRSLDRSPPRGLGLAAHSCNQLF